MNSSGETRKTIVINEGFIDPNGTLIHSSSRRKGSANKTLKNIKPSPQSKEISKQVLQKIRDRYKNTPLATTSVEQNYEQKSPSTEQLNQNPVVNEENRDLVQSIDFLEKLTQNVQARPPQPHHFETNPHELHRCYTPQYGCLKRGSLPTYRTLLNTNPAIKNIFNTTQKYRPIPPHPSIYHSHPPTHSSIYSSQQLMQPIQRIPVEPIVKPHQSHLQQGVYGQNFQNPPFLINTTVNNNEPIDQEIRDLSVRRQFAELQQGIQEPTNISQNGSLNDVSLQLERNPEIVPSPNYQKRTVRRTHRVGRSKRLPIVSVLLPNKTIRSKVATHSKTLKTLPMPQVKNSLVKTGMIKIGSEAPENVLREIYENMCLIGGPVMNYNPDVLYYNMLHNS